MSNFKDYEFKCKCGCELNLTQPELIDLLEFIRADLGHHPLYILSGTRCPTHNANVGGSSGSRHMQGLAADVYSHFSNAQDIAGAAEKYLKGQGGISPKTTACHVDVDLSRSYRRNIQGNLNKLN